MVNFGKFDKMRKISGKVDKPITDNVMSNDISFFIKPVTPTTITLTYIFISPFLSLSYFFLWTPTSFYLYLYSIHLLPLILKFRKTCFILQNIFIE